MNCPRHCGWKHPLRRLFLSPKATLADDVEFLWHCEGCGGTWAPQDLEAGV